MERSSNPNSYLTWFEVVVFLVSLFLFSVHDHLRHCCGSVKRVKKEDKATAGYRLSNSQRSPGRHLELRTIFTPDYRVSNQAITRRTSHFLRPTQTNAQLSCSLRATQVATAPSPPHPAKFSKQSFHANKTFYQGTPAADKQRDLIFFLSQDTFIVERQQTEICTQWAWKLVRVNVHLLAAVRLLRRDTVQQAAKVKIYTEQLQQQKLTLDDMGCMINHGGQGALDSKSRRGLRTRLRREGANQGFSFLVIWKKDHVLVISHKTHNKFHHFALMPIKVI